MGDKQINPTRELRSYFRDQLEQRAHDPGGIKLPDLVAEAVEFFMRKPDFVRAFVQKHLYQMVYQTASQVAQTYRPGEVLLMGDTVIDRAELAQRASVLKNRWEKWLEHANGVYKPLFDMSKSDLLAAALERRKRATAEFELATLWESMANRLDEGQIVKDVFTPEMIEQERARLRGVRDRDIEHAENQVLTAERDSVAA